MESPHHNQLCPELILECRKVYFGDLDPRQFLAPDIGKNYNGRDYHRFYIGRILRASGTPDYQAP